MKLKIPIMAFMSLILLTIVGCSPQTIVVTPSQQARQDVVCQSYGGVLDYTATESYVTCGNGQSYYWRPSGIYHAGIIVPPSIVIVHHHGYYSHYHHPFVHHSTTIIHHSNIVNRNTIVHRSTVVHRPNKYRSRPVKHYRKRTVRSKPRYHKGH